MAFQDKNIKQIYDQCSAMITNLHFKKSSISQEEMYCLLSILDMVFSGKEADDFLDLLRKWQAVKLDEEIDAIIKATLLQIDFKDSPSLLQNKAIIAELLSYNPDKSFN